MMGIMTRRFMSICDFAEGQQKTKSIQLNREHDPFEDLLVRHVATLVAASPRETPQQTTISPKTSSSPKKIGLQLLYLWEAGKEGENAKIFFVKTNCHLQFLVSTNKK